MMKLKRMLIGTCCIAFMFSCNTFAFADESLNVELDAPQIVSVETDYISFSDYLEKYGEENVIEGFNEGEAKNQAQILSIGSDRAAAPAAQNKDNTVPNDLYLSLAEGKFLGLDIIGVSDLPPDDLRFSIRLKDDSAPSTPNLTESPKNPVPAAARANNKDSYTNYDVYYSDYKPGSTDLGQAYEPLAGSYFYKYSYAFDNNYLCSTKVRFSNTQLKCGSQQNIMYTYVAAKSAGQTLDFGLMANPSDSTRNKGMYAFINNGTGYWEVEGYPKVSAPSYGNNMMTLENKEVEIRLSIGNKSAEMYMGVNGSMIYYKTLGADIVPYLISGQTNVPLTFIQAMSCVGLPDGSNTNITSESYFKNVRFSNSTLYSTTLGTRAFTTYGPATYYLFACKPSKMSFNYGSNYETCSINYIK